MTQVVAAFGLLVATLGALGILAPRRLLDLVTRGQAALGLGGIAALRIGLGIVFLLAAPASRAPLCLRVLGGLAIVSGLVSPLVGARRFEAVLAWWRARAPWVVRLWSGFVLLFGASLVFVAWPT